ncbi:hypothetical protein BTVI_153985 [Pitangus sulphuratus]|nr:hypothetical protein BTVI_153985 [Pitangus sulphuratus]
MVPSAGAGDVCASCGVSGELGVFTVSVKAWMSLINKKEMAANRQALTDVQVLEKLHFDLSKNRFTEIPPDVWLFAPLETLNLYHNCIKSIPESIKNLQMLTYLNISRNLLSTLPKYLFDLPLKVLVVSNNKLVSIPEEIGKLRDLMELICLKGKVHIFKFLSIQACLRIDKKPDSLDLPSLGKRVPSQPLTDSMEDFYPNKNHGPDSGIGSDNGDKRLSTTEPSDDDTISLHSQVSESTREQTLRSDNHVMGSKLDPQKDQEAYDYIDPNAEEGALPEQGDAQIGTLLSYVKERGKHPEKSQKIEQNEDWGDEKRLQKEQLLAEDDDELKEVTDLRKIAAQLLQQEQKHSISTNEVNSPVSPYSWQPLENQKDSVDEQHWPETQPVIWQNEERRRSKQIRKEYFKYKSSRKSSSGNENDEDYERTDSNTHGPFGLKPRSAFSRASRQDYGAVDPGFTMRRKMEHLREEREQIRQLRNNLESRLKVILPDDIGAALMDGVVLCHLANHIRPRSVASIHVPSPAVPKLSMAKCRRNVENFLDACKKLGVPQIEAILACPVTTCCLTTVCLSTQIHIQPSQGTNLCKNIPKTNYTCEIEPLPDFTGQLVQGKTNHLELQLPGEKSCQQVLLQPEDSL